MIKINIGVDIGGNHIGIGFVDEQGNLVKKEITDYKYSPSTRPYQR